MRSIKMGGGVDGAGEVKRQDDHRVGQVKQGHPSGKEGAKYPAVVGRKRNRHFRKITGSFRNLLEGIL